MPVGLKLEVLVTKILGVALDPWRDTTMGA
jgi:hypothetical protein